MLISWFLESADRAVDDEVERYCALNCNVWRQMFLKTKGTRDVGMINCKNLRFLNKY